MKIPKHTNEPSRRDEAHIQARELGVVFRNLRVTGLGASNSYQLTLGSLFNPANILESIQAARHPPVHTILTDFEGVVRPGEMLRMSINQVISHFVG